MFKKELNISFTSSLLKMVSHDSQLNSPIKSDIVYLFIFLAVLTVLNLYVLGSGDHQCQLLITVHHGQAHRL